MLGWAAARSHPSKPNTVLKHGRKHHAPSQQTQYRSQARRRRPRTIPASRIPFSSIMSSSQRGRSCAVGYIGRFKLCVWRQAESQTVHPATGRDSNCAFGDSFQIKLCLWRQLANQTVPLTTTRARFGRLFVARCTVWLPGCRQMHSQPRALSPDAQSTHPIVARCTVRTMRWQTDVLVCQFSRGAGDAGMRPQRQSPATTCRPERSERSERYHMSS